MTSKKMRLGRTVLLHEDMESSLDRVSDALKAEGFGILTEIDVQATLKNKLDVDFRPYRILGACNPQLAYKALGVMPEVGLLLPCNVIVSQVDENSVEVSILDPVLMLNVADNPSLSPVAKEAKERLDRVASALEGES